MNIFHYSCYTSSFSTIHDVIDHMHRLHSELENTDLHNVRYFNKTYIIITEIVKEKIRQNQIDDPHQMEKFDIIFAQFYFSALKRYTLGNTIPPAWKICFDACKITTLAPTIYMALGVNAHVNNDLPQALSEAHVDTEYKNDFDKVNTYIKVSLPSVIRELYETKKIYLCMQGIKIFYYPLLFSIISRWRKNAWIKYQQISNSKITVMSIEQQAEHCGKMLYRLSLLERKFKFM